MPAWESGRRPLFLSKPPLAFALSGRWTMDLFDVFRSSFVWMVTVAVPWPINIPMAGLAYKIRQGNKPIDMESDEFWWRCTGGTFILSLITLAFIYLDTVLTGDADLPPGPVHMVVFLGYLAAASWLYFIFFALEDFFQALGMVLIYLYIPMTVLYLFNLLTHWWTPLLELVPLEKIPGLEKLPKRK